MTKCRPRSAVVTRVAASLLGASLLAAPGCRREASPPADPALLRLGEQVVRESDFERHLQELAAPGVSIGEPQVRQALRASFLEERVLALEARRRGLLADGAGPEQEQRAVSELLVDAVLSTIEVSETRVAEFYEEHGESLRTPERITVSQILVPTLNEARDVRRRLLRERRSFELLARTRSQSPEGSEGGLLGTFARGELPAALEAAAFQLAPGRFSGIIETPLGYHVLRLDAREEARERTLEECRAEIHAALVREAYDRASRDYIEGLLLRAEVKDGTS